MRKQIIVPNTAWHDYLSAFFTEEDLIDRLMGLLVINRHKATRLLTGTDPWSGTQLKTIADWMEIDWYWDFVKPYGVPTNLTIDEANALREEHGEVFEPVARVA